MTVMVQFGYLAQVVDFGAAGRISAFYFIDCKDSILGVMSVEVFVQGHYDCCDFLARVMGKVIGLGFVSG